MCRLPRRWERIGDVLLLRVPPELAPWREAIATIYRDILGVTTVVQDLANVHGPWRVPEVRWLLGNGTETVHLEDGVRFKLDVADLMFSSGNLAEKVTMARRTRAGETVVDLFAGIGYFAIPIAVHARPARVVACEVNPTAFRYLLENIRLNRAGAVEARLGDCRATAPKRAADRVILGHFDAEKYLDTAFETAKDRATFHIHGLHRSIGPKPPTSAIPGASLAHTLLDSARTHGYQVRQTHARFVKWYGPHRLHFVLDAEVTRK